MTLALTCQSCKIYFRTSQYYKTQIEFRHTETQHIPLGAKGKIDNVTYMVLGFVVKQEAKYKYRWREYLLFNPTVGYGFLSEYNGHWNFIWPIENDPIKNVVDHSFYYNNNKFNLYQKYNASVVYANGEFFFDVVDITATTLNYEYISPPYMVAQEKSEDSIICFEGEYLTQIEIEKAFSISKNNLPNQIGIGYTQPSVSAFRGNALATFTIFSFLLIIIIQLIMSNSSSEKDIFHATYTDADLKDQKMIVTESFKFDDGTRSLAIQINAPVSNDWFFGEFTLINETTGEEYNFTKDIEYYSGYDDEGSWTEGSQTGEALLSQIPSGTYHLNMYPEFSTTNHSFSIYITRDVLPTANFYITLLGFSIYPIWFLIMSHRRERKRWADSDYSPYYSE
jgi:hypothetical protein